jgi:copper ion binding protein
MLLFAETIPPLSMLERIEMSEKRTYVVEGMTCDHCRLSVEEEVGEIDGVEAVGARLDDGRVQVSGEGYRDEDVQTAVAEAGYAVTGRA